VATDALPADVEEEALPLLRHAAWQAGAMAMFSVIFEVHPKHAKFDLYLELAKGLRPNPLDRDQPAGSPVVI
jgi:hypothetical protein